MTSAVEWNAVTKRYRGTTAVEAVSLQLARGEATALVGHNGAGKTTLIKLLLGLIRPDEGAVRVSGIDPAGPRGAQARRGIGFLPESVAFHDAMTGTELMAFYARLKGEPRSRNAELLERVGIAHAAGRRVGTYSKGMRQRLGIAQALIGEPRLVVFDEPTSGLDPASRHDVYAMIDAMRAGGATVLVSTHALPEIERRVDRVAIMHRGRLVSAGTLAELRHGLDTGVQVRVQLQPCTAGNVLARLPSDVRCIDRSDTALTLVVPPGRKLQVLRDLLNAGEPIRDIETHAPGLQEIHARLTGVVDDGE